jgi:hypothetical protein
MSLPNDTLSALETFRARKLHQAQTPARFDPSSDNRAVARDDDDVSERIFSQAVGQLHRCVCRPPIAGG